MGLLQRFLGNTEAQPPFSQWRQMAGNIAEQLTHAALDGQSVDPKIHTQFESLQKSLELAGEKDIPKDLQAFPVWWEAKQNKY